MLLQIWSNAAPLCPELFKRQLVQIHDLRGRREQRCSAFQQERPTRFEKRWSKEKTSFTTANDYNTTPMDSVCNPCLPMSERCPFYVWGVFVFSHVRLILEASSVCSMKAIVVNTQQSSGEGGVKVTSASSDCSSQSAIGADSLCAQAPQPARNLHFC